MKCVATVTESAELARQRALLESAFPQKLVKLPSGAHVVVRECGEGDEAVVLLHGISSGAASWLPVALRLRGIRALAWDAPGYGHSTLLAHPAPVASDYAESLHATLQTLGLRRCVLAGHSLGALVACAYAARADRVQVDRLVLISPARGYGGDPAQSERVRVERTQALELHGIFGLSSSIDSRLLSPEANEATREWVRWNASRLNAAGYLQAVRMLAGSVLLDVPPGIGVEVHCGEADQVTPPDKCLQVAGRFDAPFRLIRGAGHASPAERPAAVAEVLAQAFAMHA